MLLSTYLHLKAYSYPGLDPKNINFGILNPYI